MVHWWQVATLGKSGVSVGYYDTEEAAARAYDRAAIGLLGRNHSAITTNFPLHEYDKEPVPQLIGKTREEVSMIPISYLVSSGTTMLSPQGNRNLASAGCLRAYEDSVELLVRAAGESHTEERAGQGAKATLQQPAAHQPLHGRRQQQPQEPVAGPNPCAWQGAQACEPTPR